LGTLGSSRQEIQLSTSPAFWIRSDNICLGYRLPPVPIISKHCLESEGLSQPIIGVNGPTEYPAPLRFLHFDWQITTKLTRHLDTGNGTMAAASTAHNCQYALDCLCPKLAKSGIESNQSKKTGSSLWHNVCDLALLKPTNTINTPE